jgi:hypothetical protein
VVPVEVIVAKTLLFDDPRQSEALVEVLHDRWFDKGRISFDSSARFLRIPFTGESMDPTRHEVIHQVWKWKRVRVPIVEWFVQFNAVRRYEVAGESGHVECDFNEIHFDRNSKRFVVTTDFQLTIRIDVEKFEVLVCETDTVVSSKTFNVIGER